MAIVNGIVTVIKAIVGGIVALFSALVSCLTCGKVRIPSSTSDPVLTTPQAGGRKRGHTSAV